MSDYVIMPRADYEAACNSIRLKTGKMDLIKSGDMSAEIESITDGGTSADVRYVTFMSYDGSVEYIKLPVAVGYDCPNPKIDDPTKESDVQYNYTFAGWATTPNGGLDANALKTVNEDRTVYANFASVLRYYTITYLDTDGSVLKTVTLAYGSTPATYTPEKEGYGFEGWNPEVTTVTGNASYTAIWSEAITFANVSYAKLKEIVDAGEAQNYFKVGDTKQISMGSKGNITVAIAGFDHDNLADGSGKASMSIVCTTAPDFQDAWNPNTSSLRYDSAFFVYQLEALISSFPAALQTMMKTVSKEIDASNNSGTTPSITTHNAKLWLLSLHELGLTEPTGNRVTALGQKYDLFNEITSSTGAKYPKLSIADTGTLCQYYVRSAQRLGTWAYYYIKTDGTANYASGSGLTTTKGYWRFGFCI